MNLQKRIGFFHYCPKTGKVRGVNVRSALVGWSFFLCALPPVCFGDLINGTVIDSADGAPVYHVKVSFDSAYSVLTDSAGKFSLNTGGVGIINGAREMGPKIKVSAISGPASLQILTLKGEVVRAFSIGNLSAMQNLSFISLPAAVYLISVTQTGKTVLQKEVNVTAGSNRRIVFTQVNDDRNFAGSAQGARKKTAVSPLYFSKSAYFPKVVSNPQDGMTLKMSQNFGPSRHDFIYAGEWQNGGFANQRFFVFRGGKQVFTYTYPSQCEYGDIWMLSNGNIVYSYRWGAAEMTGTGTSVWNWADPLTNPTRPQADVHTAQPIGLDRVIVYSNGDQTLNPPVDAKMILINTKSQTQERVWIMPGAGGSHNQSRHARMTKAGTLLVAHQDLGKVSEYDTSTAKEIWSYTNCGLPWCAVRLRNGNTLVSGNQAGWVRIVNPQKQVVWELNATNFPPPAGSWFFQEVSMLDNGNVILCNQQAPDNAPGLLEVTITNPPKMVWSVLGKDLPGGISTCQILDDPGVPENGELQR